MSEAFRIAAFGATGTGKTAWILQVLERMKPTRLMVWDFKADSALAGLGQAYPVWADFVRACTQKRFVARYQVDWSRDVAEQFAAFCMLAWREGNLVMFVDELAEVTKAQKAPPIWRKCVNVGRSYDDGKKSISILGASQRPAEVDKSFTGNADVVHVGRMGNLAEAKMFAAMWGIEASELINLPNLHWIEKQATSPAVTRGVLSFGNKKPPNANKNVTKKQGEGDALRDVA
jgi:hypothetical protein